MEEILTIAHGGEIGEIVKKTYDKFYTCGSCLELRPCILISTMEGGNYSDGHGRKLNVGSICVVCGNGHAYWKIKNKLITK